MKEFGGIKWDDKKKTYRVKIRGACPDLEEMEKVKSEVSLFSFHGEPQIIFDGHEMGTAPFHWSGYIYFEKEDDFDAICKKLEGLGWVYNLELE